MKRIRKSGPYLAGLVFVALWLLLWGLGLFAFFFDFDLRPSGDSAALMIVAFLTAALLFVAAPPGA